MLLCRAKICAWRPCRWRQGKNSLYHEACVLELPVEVDDYNFITIIIEDGVKFAQVWDPYDQTGPRVRILGEHQVGNATIIETDGELGVIYY